MGARSTNCLECGAPVSLIDGEPVVRGGLVGLRCRVCPFVAAAPIVVSPAPQPATPPASPSRRPARAPTLTRARVVSRRFVHWPRRTTAIVAAVVVAGIAATGLWAEADQLATNPLVAAAPPPEADSHRLARVSIAAPEAPLVHPLTYSLTDEQAELSWVHPIAGERELPDKGDRQFGAPRPGSRPSECGDGHCGVDLGRAQGEVVHAALGGRIIRVKRDASSRSGRYVAIEHPQGLRSSYMHLDRIHPDLVAGMEIASGEAIGSVGSTGISSSPPHLHFSVERNSDSGWQYVDPEPMLTQATVLDAAAPLPLPRPKLSLDRSALSDPPPPPIKRSQGLAASEDPTE